MCQRYAQLILKSCPTFQARKSILSSSVGTHHTVARTLWSPLCAVWHLVIHLPPLQLASGLWLLLPLTGIWDSKATLGRRATEWLVRVAIAWLDSANNWSDPLNTNIIWQQRQTALSNGIRVPSINKCFQLRDNLSRAFMFLKQVGCFIQTHPQLLHHFSEGFKFIVSRTVTRQWAPDSCLELLS